MPNFKENYIQAWSEDSERIIATPSHFAKNTLFYVQEIGHFRTYPPYYTEREHLDSYLLVFTVGGAGKLTYKGETYPLRPNSIFFIDCMEYHRYWTVPGESWELLWVHFNGHAVRGYFDLAAEDPRPVRDLPFNTQIPFLIRQIIRLQQQVSLTNELLCSKWLVELLTACLLDARNEETSAHEAPDYIQGLIREFAHHYQQKLTLDRLARQFSVSKYHMAKAFKRYTGLTLNEYLINVRMTKAKEWLQYSDRPVGEIAEEVGIDNVSHFINLFKAREGRTPLVFRKQWQQPK